MRCCFYDNKTNSCDLLIIMNCKDCWAKCDNIKALKKRYVGIFLKCTHEDLKRHKADYNELLKRLETQKKFSICDLDDMPENVKVLRHNYDKPTDEEMEQIIDMAKKFGMEDII